MMERLHDGKPVSAQSGAAIGERESALPEHTSMAPAMTSAPDLHSQDLFIQPPTVWDDQYFGDLIDSCYEGVDALGDLGFLLTDDNFSAALGLNVPGNRA